MAAKLFSSQNKSSSDERDSLTSCNMHLTPCNMRKILHSYFSVQWMRIFFRYIIRGNISRLSVRFLARVVFLLDIFNGQ